MTATDITQSNQQTVEEMVAEILATVRALEQDWQAFKPLAEAFQRGGMLAARTAAKQARRNSG